MRKITILLFFCIIGALLNVALSYFSDILSLPMFLDTILTVTVTLLSGPLWGAITGVLTNIIGHTLRFWGWEGYLFAICNIATALITWMFMHFFPRELNFAHNEKYRYDYHSKPKSRHLTMVMERVIVLMLLSFTLCLAMSILGGLIAAFIQGLNPVHVGEPGLSPNIFFNMFPQGFSVILEEILVRIPMNIIDRLFAAFGGYGIALALRKVFIPKISG